jgi:hypothetical protein
MRTLTLAGREVEEYEAPSMEAARRLGSYLLAAMAAIPAEKQAEAELLAALDDSGGMARFYVWPEDDRAVLLIYSGALIGGLPREYVEDGTDPLGDDWQGDWNLGEAP